MRNQFIRRPVGILLSLLMALSVFGMLSVPAAAATYTQLPIADSDELEEGAYWFDLEGMIAGTGVDAGSANIMRTQMTYYISDDGNTIKISTREDSFTVGRGTDEGAAYFAYLKQHAAPAASDDAAQIGAEKYETLQAALEAANNSDVVTVLREISETDAYVDLGYYKTIELDLNGFTVNFGTIDTMGGLTISGEGDLYIDRLVSYNSGNQYALTLDGANVTVTGGFSWMATDIALRSGASLVLNTEDGSLSFPGFNGVDYDTAVIDIDETSQLEIRDNDDGVRLSTYNYEALAAAIAPYLQTGLAFDADESSDTCGRFYWTDDAKTDDVYPVILKQWPAHEHYWTEDDWTDNVFPDCGNDGSIGYFTCEGCGERFDQEGNLLTDEDIVIPATGNHDYEWMTDEYPGCYTAGKKHHKCTVCGNETDWDTPIPAAHEFSAWVKQTDPTCVKDGNVGYYHCYGCGDDFDADGNILETVVIPATGNHVTELRGAKEATATEDGYTGDLVCTVCGQTIKTGSVIPAAGEPTDPAEPTEPAEPAEPETPGQTGGKIHGDNCFCYNYPDSSLLGQIIRFICAVYCFFLNMRAGLGA